MKPLGSDMSAKRMNAEQEKMLNAGLVTSYVDAKGMVARVERDRKTCQSASRVGLRKSISTM